MRTPTPSRRTCCNGNAPSWRPVRARPVRALLLASITVSLLLAAAACSRNRNPRAGAPGKEIVAAKSDPALMIQPVILSDAVQVSIQKVPIDVAAAKNEWTSFTLQINELPPSVPLALRLRPLKRVDRTAAVPVLKCEAYQILPMPVDVNRAAYIRHTGQHAGGAVGDGRLPRALLPLKAGQNGLIPLTALRDPAHPFQPATSAWDGTGPIHLWVDVQ